MKMFEISTLAKTNSAQAEREILVFVQNNFPDLKATSVVINESKVSLNSVNGNIETSSGTKYFFKFHAEEGETSTLRSGEYYNTKVLYDAGLPVVMPLFEKTQPGSQFLIYEYLELPTAFDLYEKQDDRYEAAGSYDSVELEKLFRGEEEFLSTVRDIYLKTLQMTPATKLNNLPLNQLFYNRLTRRVKEESCRLELFYGNARFDDLKNAQWIINGIRYDQTLAQIIADAQKMLGPTTGEVATVIGHGDDHNGNKFYDVAQKKFLAFDAAFAGRQPALLSFIKAMAHNTVLHPYWLYDPAQLSSKLDLKMERKGNEISITHNWETKDRSPMRLQMLAMQKEIVWKPLIGELRKRGALSKDWQEYIRKALFCCPFLVLNLIDPTKRTPEQSLLALAKSVELGSLGDKANDIDEFLRGL